MCPSAADPSEADAKMGTPIQDVVLVFAAYVDGAWILACKGMPKEELKAAGINLNKYKGSKTFADSPLEELVHWDEVRPATAQRQQGTGPAESKKTPWRRGSRR